MSATNVPLPAAQSVKAGPVQGPPPAIKSPFGIWAEGVILGGLEAEVRCRVTMPIQVVLSLGKPDDVLEIEKLTSTGECVTVVDTEESYVTQKDVATLGVGEQDSIAAASAALGARPSVATKTSDNVPQLIDACRSLIERRGS